jgi:hypothetical protein
MKYGVVTGDISNFTSIPVDKKEDLITKQASSLNHG